MKKYILIFLLILICITTGCANIPKDDLVSAADKTYTPASWETCVALRGNLNADVTVKLTLDGHDNVRYTISAAEFEKLNSQYALSVDKVCVNVGDKVEEGELLISFKSETLEKQLEEYESRKDNDTLAIEHLRKLSDIDNSVDYQSEISMLEQDINIADAYISDINDIYEKINIFAEDFGTVKAVSPYLTDNYIVSGVTLIEVSSDNGVFDGVIEDDISLSVGDVFTAESGMTSYELCLSDINDTEDGNRMLTFVPAEGQEAALSENKLTLKLKKPELKNVLYIDKRAVFESDGLSYVYKLREDGLREAVNVSCGDIVGDVVVIKSGLKEADEVTLP